MQKSFKVLIGDTSPNYGVLCKEILSQEGCEVRLVQKDGDVVLNSIKEFEPDVVVIESFMARLDAIGVMKEANLSEPNKAKFIIVSGYNNKFIEQEVMAGGACYYMLKPLDIRSLCDRIISIGQHVKTELKSVMKPTESTDLETIVTEIILTLGVPAHVKGYHYIRQSIMLCTGDSAMINSVTKLLYPTVAKIYQTTASRVERAIRHAIEIAWDRGDVDILNAYFGYTINVGRGKPTNSEFIAMIADKIRLKLKNSNASLA